MTTPSSPQALVSRIKFASNNTEKGGLSIPKKKKEPRFESAPLKDSKSKNLSLRRRRLIQKKIQPIIHCTCGAEILLVPDRHAMSRAIEKHLETHVKTGKTSKADAESIEELLDFLIEQVLNAAAKA